eukprot:scaffold28005_cov78-Skeletonema_dohrnii-CCMP3373.AAC.2
MAGKRKVEANRSRTTSTTYLPRHQACLLRTLPSCLSSRNTEKHKAQTDFLRRSSLSQQIQILLILTANPSDAPCCRYCCHILSSRRPMTTMSGVLESP